MGAGAAFGAALGAAGVAAGAGAPGAGAGCWACAPAVSKVADSAVAANRAVIRPRDRTGAAKIRKFIAENPF